MVIPARKKLFKGFTLIELLIVIAILGILAAAVLVAVNPAKRQRQARDTQTKSDIAQIATAFQAYYTTPGQGMYPTEAQGIQKLVDNQDLKNLPKPPTGSDDDYVYKAVKTAGTACDNTAGNECAEVSVSAKLLDPTTADSGDVWCWKSKNGKAAEVTAALCATPLTNP